MQRNEPERIDIAGRDRETQHPMAALGVVSASSILGAGRRASSSNPKSLRISCIGWVCFAPFHFLYSVRRDIHWFLIAIVSDFRTRRESLVHPRVGISPDLNSRRGLRRTPMLGRLSTARSGRSGIGVGHAGRWLSFS